MQAKRRQLAKHANIYQQIIRVQPGLEQVMLAKAAASVTHHRLLPDGLLPLTTIGLAAVATAVAQCAVLRACMLLLTV